VLHDEDIADLQADTAVAESFQKFVGERVAGMDFVRDGDGDQAKVGGWCGRKLLSLLSSRVLSR
jgi:hypothetical protein